TYWEACKITGLAGDVVASANTCHNDLMEELTSKLRKAFRASITLSSKAPGGLDPAMRMHRAVAQAIAQHDSHLARSAMEDLLRKTIADVTELLQFNNSSAQTIYPAADAHYKPSTPVASADCFL
ncbi:MAG: FCD domain-containing protein, partial [Terriglobia bacterium]